MNTSGDPGRDDYGLPPVDVEIPNDARELDRDVQAYRRELRSRRRRVLAKRLYGPLTRDGMVLPLLAGCLALTLLAATLLTVFTVGQGTIGGPATRRSSSATSRRPIAGAPGALLPDAMVLVAGAPEHLADLTGPGEFAVVLALVPPGCNCLRDLRQLAQEAQGGRVQTYLVGIRGADVSQLTTRIGLGPTHAVEDTGDMLPVLYRNSRKLTAVLVRKDNFVTDVVSDRHGFRLTAAVHAMASAHAGGSP